MIMLKLMIVFYSFLYYTKYSVIADYAVILNLPAGRQVRASRPSLVVILSKAKNLSIACHLFL